MEKKRYFVNIDYEYGLNKKRSKNTLGFNLEFEHLFLWIEDFKNILNAQREYDPDYLNYITEIRGGVPSIEYAPFQNLSENWWGREENLDLERFLNSKITSSTFAIENNLSHPETRIIHDMSEIENINFDGRYYGKLSNGFSGLGNFKLTRKNLNKIIFPFVLEPYLEIIKEFGLTINGDDLFLVESFQRGGHFFGGETKYFKEESEIIETLGPVIKYYREQNYEGSFEIDCFYYRENNKKKFYALSEVNYRKTMSFFINYFLKRNFNLNYGRWIFSKNKKNFSNYSELLDSFGKLLYNKEKGYGIIPISPIDGKFLTYYIVAENEKELDRLTREMKGLINY